MTEDIKGRMDALSRRADFLQETLTELEDENEELRERVEQLEQVVDPDPTRLNWEQMSKRQKVAKIRRSLIQYAEDGGGVSKMNYKEVKALFDGQPSNGYAYELMEDAAEPEGFKYNAPKHGNKQGEKRIRCNLDALKAEAGFRSPNNEVQSTGQP